MQGNHNNDLYATGKNWTLDNKGPKDFKNKLLKELEKKLKNNFYIIWALF